MRSLQCYKLCTTGLYVVVCNIIIPIILIFLWLSGFNDFFGMNLCVLLVIMMLLEIIEDYWGLGSMVRKGGNKFEFIKSAFHGDVFIKKAIIVDIIIRPIRILFVLFISAFINCFKSGNICIFIAGFLMITLISISTVNITRCIESFYIVVLISNIIPFAAISIIVLLYNYLNILITILAVLVLASGILTYKHMGKNIKDSYFDL